MNSQRHGILFLLVWFILLQLLFTMPKRTRWIELDDKWGKVNELLSVLTQSFNNFSFLLFKICHSSNAKKQSWLFSKLTRTIYGYLTDRLVLTCRWKEKESALSLVGGRWKKKSFFHLSRLFSRFNHLQLKLQLSRFCRISDNLPNTSSFALLTSRKVVCGVARMFKTRII